MESLGPCELCGHPVYEWQKHEREAKFWFRADSEATPVEDIQDWLYTHLNPADHQPTVLPALDTPAEKT